MKFVNCLAFFSLLFVAVSSCSNDDEKETSKHDNEMFPIAIGNKWEYNVTNSSGTSISTVTLSSSKNIKLFSKKLNDINLYDYTKVSNSVSCLYGSGSVGYVTTDSGTIIVNSTNFSKTKLGIVPVQLSSADSVVIEAFIPNNPTVKTVIVGSNETGWLHENEVTSNGKVYNDIWVDYTKEGNPADEGYAYYKKGIGRIKLRIVHRTSPSNESIITEELVSYKLN